MFIDAVNNDFYAVLIRKSYFHSYQLSKMAANKRRNLFLLKDGYYPLPSEVDDDMYFQGFFSISKVF